MTQTRKPEMGKWGLYKFFKADTAVSRYLPPTAVLNCSTLQSFLSNHSAVYIKPANGSTGRGVIKVWKHNGRYAYVKEKGTQLQFSDLDSLYRKLRAEQAVTKAIYIIQRAIPLAQIKGRPFDVRLMMMRNESGHWEYVGMAAKVAGPKSIITNVVRSKGYILSVDDALKQSLGLSSTEIDNIKRQMIHLGYKTCHRFDSYKRYWQIGLDLAVDQNRKVWIIEQNTGPAHFLFAKLKNPTAFRRIKQLAAFRRRKTH
ncbi:YheC/YheD family protein [Effusibacillus dendaii]|uniref:YheC/YheD family protein n=1 Tax=Effusibacillus dendaii TaxID=2743772 RepID=A0A7I8D9B9_9BACL|nr:YheC/YheD family protein [Effusibacillus dendaii]BCJ86738.1 hypothetical protein skT53_17230 [Effusibacillus dendaii]